MNVVWSVGHERPVGSWRAFERNEKHLGFFLSVEDALAVIDEVKDLEGFKGYPSGFFMRRLVVDSSVVPSLDLPT